MFLQTGLTLESALKEQLEKQYGVVLASREEWDHRYKLDFIVYAMAHMNRIPATGVQVTQKLDDMGKISEFLSANQTASRVADRIVYLEIESGFDEKHVGESVFALLRQIQLDQNIRGVETVYVRLCSDLTYRIENLRKHVEAYVQEKKAAVKPAVAIDSHALAQAMRGEKPIVAPPKEAVEAVMTNYSPGKGIGFATTKNSEVFFIHISNIVDPSLRERLIAYSGTNDVKLDQPVAFRNGGRTRPDARYPEAFEIVALG